MMSPDTFLCSPGQPWDMFASQIPTHFRPQGRQLQRIMWPCWYSNPGQRLGNNKKLVFPHSEIWGPTGSVYRDGLVKPSLARKRALPSSFGLLRRLSQRTPSAGPLLGGTCTSSPQCSQKPSKTKGSLAHSDLEASRPGLLGRPALSPPYHLHSH